MNETHSEQPRGHVLPGEGVYFAVFLLLAILTVAELVTTYLPQFAKVPILLGLMAGKAWLVVQFYMHLRYDSRILTWSFLIPVIVGVIAALVLQPLLSTVPLAH
jgi:caa(3)-type oxidase subunit IV